MMVPLQNSVRGNFLPVGMRVLALKLLNICKEKVTAASLFILVTIATRLRLW